MYEITYTIKGTIYIKSQDRYKDLTINKSWSTDIPMDYVYDNKHLLEEGSIYTMLGTVLTSYLTEQKINSSDIEIESYEVVPISEGVQIYFANPANDNMFTLTPELWAFVEKPKVEFVAPPDFIGQLVDDNAIVWSWSTENYGDCGFYLLDKDNNIIAQLPVGTDYYMESNLFYNTTYTRQLVAYNDESVSTKSEKISVTTKEEGVVKQVQNAIIEYEEPYTATIFNPIEEKFNAFSSGVGVVKSGTSDHLFVSKEKSNEYYDIFNLQVGMSTTVTSYGNIYDKVNFKYQFLVSADVPEYHKEGFIKFLINAYKKGYVEYKRDAIAYMPLNVRWMGYVDISYPEIDDAYMDSFENYYRNLYS